MDILFFKNDILFLIHINILFLGASPLICAVVDHDNEDLLEVLLKYGANPTHQDENGMTALDIAAALDKSNFVKILLSHEQEQQKRAIQDS